MRLFSYCIPVDDGAAPNPYWDVCTLVVCKPRIRSVAKKGDWIVGIGSKVVAGGKYQKKVIYTMKITQVMSMREYDAYCKEKLPNKIPDIKSTDYKRQVGDCLYDFNQIDAEGKPFKRPGVHGLANRDHDLGGKNALLSEHFYYFGDKPIDLPEHLHPIIKQGQWHRSNSNDPYKEEFVQWIEAAGHPLNCVIGDPEIKIDFSQLQDENCETACGVTNTKKSKSTSLC